MNLFNDSNKNDLLKLDDETIAIDILKDSKSKINSLASAASEAVNPQLRQLINTELINSINSHHELSDIAIHKNWYEAYEDPKQQLKNNLIDAKKITSDT